MLGCTGRVPLGILLLATGASAASTCTEPRVDVMKYAIENEMSFFPPGEDESTISVFTPLEVFVGMANLRILSTDTASNTFTVGLHVDMHWTASDCLQSNVLMTACAERLGSFYFLEAPMAIGDFTTISSYTVPASSTAGAMVEFGSGCTNGDYLSLQGTFSKTYDMGHFPFESHQFSVALQSRLTSQSINLISVGQQPALSDITAPSAWTLDSGWRCLSGINNATEPSRGNTEMSFPYVECTIQLSKVDWSWFLNSYVLFLTVVLTNGFVSLGFTVQPLSSITGGPTDPRELPLQLGQRAGITAAFALAYIFAIEYKPYGQSLNSFVGGMPLSAITYFSGLVCLSLSGLWTAVAGYGALVLIRGKSRKGKVKPSSTTSGEKSRTDADGDDEVAQTANARSVGKKLALIDWYIIAILHAASVIIPSVMLISGAYNYRTIRAARRFSH